MHRRHLTHPRDRIRRLQDEQRQGDERDGVAEDGERLSGPEDQEVPIPRQGQRFAGSAGPVG